MAQVDTTGDGVVSFAELFAMFSRHGDVNAAPDRDMREEATKVLSQAFPSCIDALTHDGRPNLDQLVEIVRDKSNYEITGVTRVMNRTRQVPFPAPP